MASRNWPTLVAPYGYSVRALPISGCLHLKSAVTLVDDETMLVQPEWIDAGEFSAYRVILVDPREAARRQRIARRQRPGLPVLFSVHAGRLREAGIEVSTVDVSELQKAEGAVTCCSLIFKANEPGLMIQRGTVAVRSTG